MKAITDLGGSTAEKVSGNTTCCISMPGKNPGFPLHYGYLPERSSMVQYCNFVKSTFLITLITSLMLYSKSKLSDISTLSSACKNPSFHSCTYR